ncbi:hypothetical protein YC2023_089791 [Brassica napus]
MADGERATVYDSVETPKITHQLRPSKARSIIFSNGGMRRGQERRQLHDANIRGRKWSFSHQNGE